MWFQSHCSQIKIKSATKGWPERVLQPCVELMDEPFLKDSILH